MLKLALEDQKKLLERISNAAPAAGFAGASASTPEKQDFTLPSKTLGQVASATPLIPPSAVVPPAVWPLGEMRPSRLPERPPIHAKRFRKVRLPLSSAWAA